MVQQEQQLQYRHDTDQDKFVTSDDAPSLLKFPNVFPIKVVGLASVDFVGVVLEIVGKHTDDVGEVDFKSRSSKRGKYVAVTVTIQAQDQAQLDAIYHELSSDERILMAL
jgi:putative lipoic acid-binding regulatory protein